MEGSINIDKLTKMLKDYADARIKSTIADEKSSEPRRNIYKEMSDEIALLKEQIKTLQELNSVKASTGAIKLINEEYDRQKLSLDAKGKQLKIEREITDELERRINQTWKYNKENDSMDFAGSTITETPEKIRIKQIKELDNILTQVNKSQENAQKTRIQLEKSENPQNNPVVISAKELTKEIELQIEKMKEQEVITRQSVGTSKYKDNLDLLKEQQVELDGMNKNLRLQQTEVKNLDKFWGNMGYQWKKAFTSFSMYLSVTTVFYQITRGIRSMIDEVVDLDSSLLELRKVTDLEGNSLNEFIGKAYEAGTALAKTGKDVIEATTEFAKAGYNEDTAMQLGKVALMYTNIADEAINAADASNFIIAQMKAFNIEASKSEHIIDAVNEVANKYAVSSADIANNLGASSAVMANANNTMEQSIGLLTAGTEITRNASKVSNGLKTITLRLQGMNDEGERDLELMPKLEESFNKLGLSLQDENGNLKSTYEIMKELAPIYQTMDSATKAYYTELIAGKFQAQNAAAILNNFSTAISATETAMNSAGSASRENEKVLDSIKGKINNFQSAFQKLSVTLVSSDVLKFLIDFGTVLLNIADSGISQVAITLGLVSVGINLLSKGFVLAKTKVLEFAAAQMLGITVIDDTTKALIAQKAATITLGDAFTIMGKKALTTLLAIIANPITWIAATIVGVVSLVNLLNKTNERAQAVYDNAISNYEKAKEETKKVERQLDETSKKIDELNNKDKLTFTEKDELENLKKVNSELQVQLDILKKTEDIKAKEKTKAANKRFEGTYGHGSIKQINKDDLELINITSGAGYGASERDRNIAQKNYKGSYDSDILFKNAINRYKELSDITKKTSKEQEEFDYLQKTLGTHYEELSKDVENLTGKSKTYAEALREILGKGLSPEKWKGLEFQNIINNEKFSNVAIKMKEIASTGALTVDSIDDLRKEFTKFDEALSSAGITSQDFINNLAKQKEETRSLSDSISDLLGSNIDKLSKYADGYTLLIDAVKEYNKEGELSVETMAALIDGDLLKYLNFTKDGLVSNTTELKNNADETKQKMIADIQASAAQQIYALTQEGVAEQAKDTKAKISDVNTVVNTSKQNFMDAISSGIGYAATLDTIAQAAKGKGLTLDVDKYGAAINKIISDSKNYVKAIEAIDYTKSKSSKSEKTWWEKQLDSLKQKFSYNEITLQEYIDGLSSLLSKLKQGSDEWKKVNDELQKQKISKIENDYKNLTISLETYIARLKDLIKVYKQGSEAWNDLAQKIKQANLELLNNRKSDYEKALKAANKLVDDEIDKINDLRDATEKRYNDEIAAKKKSNDETDRAIQLAELQQKLENARNEKNKRVFREGLGWVWEADQEAIKNAEKELADFKNNEEIRQLEEARDAELAILDDKIANWERYKESWSNIASEYEDQQNALMLAQQFGADFESKILAQRLDALESFRNKYIDIQKEIALAEKQSIDGVIPVTGATATSNSSKTYTVKAGDSLSKIANMYGTSIDAIYNANKSIIGANKNLIYAGQQLTIPGFKNGGMIDYTGLAMVHGTPNKPEWMFNDGQIKTLITSLVKPNVSYGANGNTTGNVYNYNFDKLVLENVDSPQQFITELKSLINITKHQ